MSTIVIRQNEKRLTIRGFGGVAASGGSGWIKISDASPSAGGAVSGKTYQDTNNTVLQSFVTSDGEVDLTVLSSYPLVSVGGDITTLTQSADSGHYSGTVPLTLIADGTVTVTSTTPNGGEGATDTVSYTIDAPPAITEAIFTGGYPGSQTELKAGDTFNLQVTADKAFDRIVLADSGVSAGQITDVASGLSATIAVTIADRGNTAQQLAASLQVRDSVTGALSASYSTDSVGSVDGTNVLTLNDLHPTVVWGAITYPGAQSALKNSESATVAISILNADTASFTSAGTGQLDITNPTTIETPKTVTRISGNYNISVENLLCTANRAANDADTTDDTIVNIAHSSPAIDVSVPYARLRSGGNNGTSVQDYTVTITSDQNLSSAPTLAADSGGNRGTFQGAGFVGGPTVWTRTIRVDETIPDEKGVFSFESLVATGLAGVTQNTINSGANYILGGFVSRDVTFQAFQTISDNVGVEISDFSKIQAGLWEASGNQSIRQPIGTSPPVVEGYTSQQAVGANPHNVEWLDTVRAGSSSGVSRLFDYEEVI